MLRLLISVLFSTYSVLGAEYHKDENTCPEHWTDGSLVDMGCLLFDSSTTYSWTNAHTSYLSREPRVYSCKFFLAGVNFYRLTEEWRRKRRKRIEIN